MCIIAGKINRKYQTVKNNQSARFKHKRQPAKHGNNTELHQHFRIVCTSDIRRTDGHEQTL